MRFMPLWPTSARKRYVNYLYLNLIIGDLARISSLLRQRRSKLEQRNSSLKSVVSPSYATLKISYDL